MRELVQRMRIRKDAAAVTNAVRIHPVVVHITVEDLAPFTAARKPDAVVEPVERRQMHDDQHIVAGILDPSMKRKHAISVMHVHNAEALAAQAWVPPAQVDQLAREPK